MMSENRRWEARVDAKIRVAVVRGRRTVPLETSDVSFKGCFLRTNEPPPVRSLLRLRVSLPQREIEAHAMAVHVSAPKDSSVDDIAPPTSGVTDNAKDADAKERAGVGVQFWGLAGPDRVAWDDFVRELILLERAEAKRKALIASIPPPPPPPPPPPGQSTEIAALKPSGVRLASSPPAPVAKKK